MPSNFKAELKNYPLLTKGINVNIFIFKHSKLAMKMLHKDNNNLANMFNGKYIFKGIGQ